MEFIAQMEQEIQEHQWIQVLDISLKGTPVRWWAACYAKVDTWSQVTELLCA